MNDIAPARGVSGKFRSKKLDFSKPLRVYTYSELEPDEIDELFTMSRAVPVVATGVDKEEERVFLFDLLYFFVNNMNRNTTWLQP